MKTQLRFKLDPRLKFFLKSPLFQIQTRLLRLNKGEIEKFLKEAAEANPFLEWKTQDYQYIPASPEEKSLQEILERTAADEKETQQKTLINIYAEMKDETEREIAEYLIASLNSKGFLESTPQEIAQTLRKDRGKIEKVWENIKALFGDGTAASGVQESLIIQAQAKGWELEKRIIQEAFFEFKRLQLEKIAKKTGIHLSKVKKAVRNIKKLSPYPAVRWKKDSAIIPEFKLIKKDEEFYIQDSYPLQLHINKEYYETVKNGTKSTSFAKEKLRQAEILTESLRKREEILKRVTEFIIKKQKNYLLGKSEIKEITLDDISKTLALNKTTVSRAVKDKYLIYQNRTFRLQELITHKKQKGKSYHTACQIILQAVKDENKNRPFSDKDLQGILKKEGIHIDRRLVTKYRLKLGIPSSFMRKRLARLREE